MSGITIVIPTKNEGHTIGNVIEGVRPYADEILVNMQRRFGYSKESALDTILFALRKRIIDFDEFGLTSMPLHDQFGLALSTHELVSADGPWRPLANDVQACLAPVLSAQPALAGHIRGLLVHHLLWNVSQFHGQRSRARRVKAVLKLLEEFAAAPGNYLPPRAS